MGTLSSFIGYIHLRMILSGWIHPPAFIHQPDPNALNKISEVWQCRLMRRMISFLVRTPLKKTILNRVKFQLDLPENTGCVIVTCHTPWKRLLVQWCKQQRFGFIISPAIWHPKNRVVQRKAIGEKEIRELITALKNGKHVIFACDVFNEATDCPVNFMGSSKNASLVPARLALLAHVPLLTALIKYKNGQICIEGGHSFYPGLDLNHCHDANCVTQQVLHYFDEEIRRQPGIWPGYVR